VPKKGFVKMEGEGDRGGQDLRDKEIQPEMKKNRKEKERKSQLSAAKGEGDLGERFKQKQEGKERVRGTCKGKKISRRGQEKLQSKGKGVEGDTAQRKGTGGQGSTSKKRSK